MAFKNERNRNNIRALILILLFATAAFSIIHAISSNLNQTTDMNLLSPLSKDQMEDFKWLNKPASYKIENGILTIEALKGTDFFNNPVDQKVTATAPFLYKEIKGDFEATALVKPDFSSMWNAVSLMVHIDEDNWMKFAFENSDATGKSIVTVVTKEFSDDANGVILETQEQVWLKLIRKNNVYAMHWSIDGDDFKMARLTAMNYNGSVKIGVEAQCPVGGSATHEILQFEVVEKTVEDLRKGE